ncbi:GNAT family N-acetyltransferase [Chroococcidiopsis thermalis]|uniref:GCN5-related N-acetyltransferase n=1 Tax=Chroococcidiopsis thermalis (strain PCC 7203) TaxID=251229 RepID=K9U2W0_CHRTP|nr:GNAT family N-acetyltransferase [Chroococcidiopsis thermalis]AFY89422.1 GCN5-related N-acetyltransferase [Chroococcidiopsis thermalis PCC 7203]
MIIREANLNDVQAIARVHVDTWYTTYKGIIPESYLAKLSYQQREIAWQKIIEDTMSSSQFVDVAENNSGEIIGFANSGKERTSDRTYKGELYAIYILAAYQRQGIGYKLTLSAVDKLSELGFNSMLVWVLANNPACGFYENIGGQKVYEKQIERGGVMLKEIAYGWQDITSVRDRISSR